MSNVAMLKAAHKVFDDRSAIHRDADRAARHATHALGVARAAAVAANAAVTAARDAAAVADTVAAAALAETVTADNAAAYAWEASLGASDALTLARTLSGTIELHPDACFALGRYLLALDWKASERGDMGTVAAWEADGDAFAEAVHDADSAVDASTGAVDGDALADALETMSATENRWGDDPQSRRARHTIAQTLGWNMDEGRDLVAMLRAG